MSEWPKRPELAYIRHWRENRQKQRDAEIERREREQESERKQIIAALEGIKNQNNTATQEQNAAEQIRSRWERRRFWLDLAAVIAVFFAAAFAGGQLIALRGQQAVMQGQLSAMEADQRPWIKADIEIASDLTFRETAADIKLKYTVKNTGHSPALTLNVFPIIVPYHHASAGSKRVDILLKEHCDYMSALFKETFMRAWGTLLFPGDTEEIQEFASIEIPKITVEKPASPPQPAPAPAPAPAPSITSPYLISPNGSIITSPYIATHPSNILPQPPNFILLLSCVYYESAGETRQPHHSAESLYLEKIIPNYPDAISTIDLTSRETIPKDGLKLVRPQFEWRKYGD